MTFKFAAVTNQVMLTAAAAAAAVTTAILAASEVISRPQIDIGIAESYSDIVDAASMVQECLKHVKQLQPQQPP